MNTLRPNQVYALEAIPKAVEAGYRNICLTGPTGSGKSRIMYELLAGSSDEMSLYTDRRMLLRQIAKGLSDHGIEYGFRAAGEQPALLRRVQLTMMQTEGKRANEAWEIHPAKTILIDELHKMSAGTMQTLLEHHRAEQPHSVMVGFTATPLGLGHLCDKLIQAGTVSEMRDIGALVPAYHYGPDEPDTKWIGKIAVDGGECGIPQPKRMEFAHRVFGRVTEQYELLNPERKPGVLFAPGVAESLWFAQELCRQGIPAAHIDGEHCWIDGEQHDTSDELRQQILDASKDGRIKIIANRFVLREGIDAPWWEHCIMATVFGSLTSYLQAGGRMLRASKETGKTRATIQDHGGNWHRHGSLNSDREWNLGYDDRIVAGLRAKSLREKKEPEPICCPKCYALRLSGPKCPQCGFEYNKRVRSVLQKDGSLKPMYGDIFRPRRQLSNTERLREEWTSRIRAIRKSSKPTVASMTFSQAEVAFARDHNWGYPPHSLPMMPVNDIDWFMPVKDVPVERLTR